MWLNFNRRQARTSSHPAPLRTLHLSHPSAPIALHLSHQSHLSHLSRVKTCYLYTMKPRLVNVRLDADRLRKARALRKRGVALSDVVREAIDERYGQEHATSLTDAKALIERLFEQHPDPPDLPARSYDVHDRAAARRAIIRRLTVRGMTPTTVRRSARRKR